MNPQVLIVGAGPTGLALALWLARAAIPFRIIDKNSAPGQASRAIVVQARILEFYQQLGFAHKLVAAGIPLNRLHLREGTEEKAVILFGEFGKGLSPFPYALSYSQDDHERLLVDELKQLGIAVEWQTQLTHFDQTAAGVHASLQTPAGSQPCDAAFLCGCDGAHSTVRESLHLQFPGGTYEQSFFVADLEASGTVANGDVNVCIGKQIFYATFPVRRPGQTRLIGTVPPELSDRDDLNYEHLRQSVEQHIALHVTHVNWFSKYRVHHRVTDRFSVGRTFIAGDAAHIHSPVGGQGMNTGIGDALNLAWKLAAVLQQCAAPAILETYHAERIGFARSLVATTDRLFQGIVGKSLAAEMFRTLLLPHIIPWIMGFRAVRKAQFQLISQTRIHYPDSPLSAGHAGDVRGGDRLPWVEAHDNFSPLQSLDWQLHVYGHAPDVVLQWARHHALPLHTFPWTDAHHAAGFQQNACYLVRPDGYVSFAGKSDDLPQATAILDRFQIRPATPARPSAPRPLATDH